MQLLAVWIWLQFFFGIAGCFPTQLYDFVFTFENLMETETDGKAEANAMTGGNGELLAHLKY